MKFDLTRPCPLCPFRTDLDSGPYLYRERARQIVETLKTSTFECHETSGLKDCKREAQHCAGALIMLERSDRPSQMMRIVERLGMYDRRKLDMSSPVFDTPEEWIEANNE